MSDGSDIEMHSDLPKKITKKKPTSPTEKITKKITTKEMIHEALLQLKSRKGVSLQAIKKYLKEKYEVDTERMNYIIKKNIKNGVENGSIVQLKGIGASGSFKFVEKKPEKKKKLPANPEKLKKPKTVEEKSEKKKAEKSEKKKSKSIEKTTDKKQTKKTEAAKTKTTKAKTNKKAANKEEKTEKKIAKVLKTPAKKKAIMMKRKSIGSIIKPPKMKPTVTKAKA